MITNTIDWNKIRLELDDANLEYLDRPREGGGGYYINAARKTFVGDLEEFAPSKKCPDQDKTEKEASLDKKWIIQARKEAEKLDIMLEIDDCSLFAIEYVDTKEEARIKTWQRGNYPEKVNDEEE